MAQEKVAAYTSAAEAAEVSGNDSGYVSAAQKAAQNARLQLRHGRQRGTARPLQ